MRHDKGDRDNQRWTTDPHIRNQQRETDNHPRDPLKRAQLVAFKSNEAGSDQPHGNTKRHEDPPVINQLTVLRSIIALLFTTSPLIHSNTTCSL